MEKYIPYQSYLLRLWPTRRSGVAGFRVSLESVASGERRDFPDLGRLLAFLRAQEEGILKDSEDTSDGPQYERDSSRVCHPTLRRLAKPPYNHKLGEVQ